MVIVVKNQKTSKINKLKLKILKKMRIKLVETNFLFNNNQCQLKSLYHQIPQQFVQQAPQPIIHQVAQPYLQQVQQPIPLNIQPSYKKIYLN
jgi:hypothetical protein